MPPAEVADGVLAGRRRAIGRAISMAESLGPEGREVMRLLHPRAGRAMRIGITGSPGAGKSTLSAAIVRYLRARGLTVAIVSVDPTSPFTRGAVLGDRIRLVDHFLDEGVFIRSMASRGHLGGLAEATGDAVTILDAAGFDVVIVETVGAGQNEVEVQALADTVVLVLMPGSGDAIQAIKAGVMEIPDVVALTKSDLPGVDAFRGELRLALGIDPERAPLLVEVSVPNGTGVAEVLDAAERARAGLGDDGVRARRRAGRLNEAVQTAAARAAARADRVLRSDPEVVAAAERLERGELDPLALVRLIEARSGEAP